MLSYVLIGLGGALGSMTRAWVAVAMARLTGPAFPWGTILINVTGSCLIGFAASLTAADGRIAGAAAARTFVMVGFCGGYTTFSSFSLQTLDLIRDGRGAQALGNVALSVLLCLGAVAVGHQAGTVLRPTRQASAEPRTEPRAGLGHILAVIDRPARAGAVLDAAEHWRALTGAGNLRALLVHAAPAPPFLPSEEVLSAERVAEQDAAAGLARLRAAVAAWPGGTVAISEAEEHPAAAIVANWASNGTSGGAGAIVLARPGPHDPPWVHQALHAALFDARAPVLALPPTGPDREPGPQAAPQGGGQAGPRAGQVIAVLWRPNDPSLAASLAAAAPALAHAARILLLHAGDRVAPPPLPAALIGLPARSLAVPRDGQTDGAALLAAATAEGADLLVLGAFAHGAWREAVLGGVTRHVLEHARIALLLHH